MNNDFINAVKNHDYGYLNKYIISGQTPNVVGDDGKSALLIASEAHDPPMVQWLLEHGTNVDFYNPDYKIIDQRLSYPQVQTDLMIFWKS
jgi:ankyrin repeat protein